MAKIDIKKKLLQYAFFIIYNLRVRIIPEIDLNINKFVYLLLEKLDPSPKKKKNENDMNWYKRIDIKYALRHAKFFNMYSKFVYMQINQKAKLGLINDMPKKSKKAYVDLMNTMYGLSQQCEEKYNMMLIRKRLEETDAN